MQKLLLSLLVVFGLLSCKSTDYRDIAAVITAKSPNKAAKVLVNKKSHEYARDPNKIAADIKAFNRQLTRLEQAVIAIWGESETILSDRKKVVKYSENYHTRAIVDFASGFMRVETKVKKNAKQSLITALTHALLAPENPEKLHLLNADPIDFDGMPFLLGQIKDQDGKDIRYLWRAKRFARYAVNQKTKQQRGYLTVKVALTPQHQDIRGAKYRPYIVASAKKYNISAKLIASIIQVESNYNPFAVSHAGAYGLMQVVPRTAGRDVYQKILKRSGEPNKKQLFNPATNIDIGTAYLSLLTFRYLKDINNGTSRQYAVISAYNGGSGNVYKTFSSQKKWAIAHINRIIHQQVYEKLTKNHPLTESRHYLYKVNKAFIQ